ncbi:MAG TPA: hypothetical protein VK668_04370 [Mucilaginibacter sp.]|nr:hypothetical protein [Mucilaginibacter sp.]
MQKEYQEQDKAGRQAQDLKPAEKRQPVLAGLENIQPGKKFGYNLFGGGLY